MSGLLHWLRTYFVLLALFFLLLGCESKQDKSPVILPLTVADLLSNDVVDGYQRAINPRRFHFPEDHASHSDFRNEWWYITGNVRSVQGHEFGYQVTFFRIALQPQQMTKRTSRWASKQVWMAHVALTDINAQHYYHGQRFARDALGLAGFQQQPFKVWLEDWQISAKEKGVFPWQIHIQHENVQLDLTLAQVKPPVLQGEHGLSQKSAEQGNASYYYSMTQLQTTGQISISEQSYKVSGKSWLDREWSTSALGKDQVGWDWFALQFDDDTELMYYQMRTKSGKVDPHSTGKYIDTDSRTINIPFHDIQLTPLKIWTSTTGRKYPIHWRMHLPNRPATWRIEAQFDAQEMQGVVNYWEGVVRIMDERTQQQVGKGYLEMTGY